MVYSVTGRLGKTPPVPFRSKCFNGETPEECWEKLREWRGAYHNPEKDKFWVCDLKGEIPFALFVVYMGRADIFPDEEPT